MLGIRRFVEEDIPNVVRMNIKLFPGSSGVSEEVQRSRFKEICFQNPWYDERISSLVYEDAQGKIVGFVAVVPRLMKLNGRTIVMAVTQHLMVDPESRSMLAALELTQRAMSGPQDLTVADIANDVSRKLWERSGGSTSYLYSMHWRAPLRPVSLVLDRILKGPLRTLLAAAALPVDKLLNAVAQRIFASQSTDNDKVTIEDLSAEMLLSLLPEFYGGYSLLPAYDVGAMRWLFDMEFQEQRFGTFQKYLVRGSGGNVLGWFIYHLKHNGTSDVLQIGARESTMRTVFEALIAHALQGGATELCGRVEPRLMKEFDYRRCFFMPGRSWVLISSKIPEAMQAFSEGKAFLSRLEGDPWFL